MLWSHNHLKSPQLRNCIRIIRQARSSEVKWYTNKIQIRCICTKALLIIERMSLALFSCHLLDIRVKQTRTKLWKSVRTDILSQRAKENKSWHRIKLLLWALQPKTIRLHCWSISRWCNQDHTITTRRIHSPNLYRGIRSNKATSSIS